MTNLTLEEILEVVKIKYPNAEIDNDKIIIGWIKKSIDKVDKLIFIRLEEKKIVIIQEDYVLCCITFLDKVVLNNIIELKHILEMDITFEDVRDYVDKNIDLGLITSDDYKVLIHLPFLKLTYEKENQFFCIKNYDDEYLYIEEKEPYKAYLIIKNLIEE